MKKIVTMKSNEAKNIFIELRQYELKEVSGGDRCWCYCKPPEGGEYIGIANSMSECASSCSSAGKSLAACNPC